MEYWGNRQAIIQDISPDSQAVLSRTYRSSNDVSFSHLLNVLVFSW